MLVETMIHTGRGFQILEIYEWNVDFYMLSGGNWYNNQINARALIGQSAMVYCAGKLMEKSRVFWISSEFFSCSTNIPRGLSAYKP